MSKPNQMYLAVLAVSMVLILAYMYMCRCYQDQQLAVKDSVSIWGKMGEIIGFQSEQIDEDCESDTDVFEFVVYNCIVMLSYIFNLRYREYI